MNDPSPHAPTVKSHDVPQANSLDRIRKFVEAIRDGSTQKKQIQAATGLSARHADYYGQAAKALGWVDRDADLYSLRPEASALLETKSTSDEERDVFAASIEACPVIRALAPDLLSTTGPSEDELTDRIRTATDLAEKTARRRAEALLMWRARVVTEPGEEEKQDLVPLFEDDDAHRSSRHIMHARVQGLEISRFKGIRAAYLDLNALTLFVGPHGAGKSSLRDLFRFLHAVGRGYSLPETAGERWSEAGTLEWPGIRGGPKELPYLGGDTFSISAQLAVPDGNQMRSAEYVVEVRVPDEGPPRVVRERLIVQGRGPYVFDSHPAVDPPLQVPDRLAVRLGPSSRFNPRRVTLLVDPKRPALSQLALHPAVRARPVTDSAALVASAFRSFRFLDPSTEPMRRPSLPDQLVLGHHGENLSSVLHAIASEPNGRHALLQSLRAFTDGNVKDIAFLPDATGRVLLALVDRHGTRLSAHSVSDGVLRYLALLAALLGPESPGFWFVDNLDSGFSPSKLGLVLEMLQRHVTSTHRQILVTLRDEDALDAVDLTPQTSTSAYHMSAYGWNPPKKLGDETEETDVRPPKRMPADNDDPNERLPF